MNVSLWIQLSGSLDKVVYKFVVLLAANSLLSQSQVQVVVQELIIVRAAVQYHGQCTVGVNTSAERGERQLGARDEDATDALVSNTEDLLSVYVYSACIP